MRIGQRTITFKLKEKTYSVVSTTLFCMILFGFFAIRPSLLTLIALRTELAELKQIDRALTRKIDDIVLTKANYIENASIIYNLEQSLPELNIEAEALNFLSNTARNFNVVITNATYSGFTPLGENLKQRTARLTLSGTYKDLMALIEEFEQSSRVLQLQNLSISSNTGVSKNKMTITADITLFYFKELQYE